MDYAQKAGPPELLVKLAVGQVESDPFSTSEIGALKEDIVRSLAMHGMGLQRSAQDRKDVPIDFRFMQLLLKAAGDPDVSLGDFARGVRVGPGARLPRLPALCARKRKWKLPEQNSPASWQEDSACEGRCWRQNYSTLRHFENQVVQVLEDQATRGQVLKFGEQEARERFPGLVIASLGAQRKEKPNGKVSARVLFDGTNGILVNKRTRVRDQERSPIAADVKRYMREKASIGEKTFALTADIKEAHRQIPIAPDDWKYLGCQVRPGETVYINTVGTFGIASASYWWSRVATALGRLAQYVPGKAATTWHLLVADDFHLEAGGSEYRAGLITFFILCSLIGIPLSWNKTAGGDVISWVGLELSHSTHQLGITEKRAAWFIQWTQEHSAKRFVHMARYEEGLGRLMFVAGALEFERPFLAPLYKYMVMHPRSSVRKIPPYVAFFMQYLSQQVAKKRHYDCAMDLQFAPSSPRVDAQASRTRTGLGGWLPEVTDGKIDLWSSRWFSLEVKREDFPWVFEKEGEPSRVIATLEALAVLISLKAFFGNVDPGGKKTRVQVVPTWTDNRGNGSVLNKLMTTRYPASAVLMEMAAFMQENALKASVMWTPRETNREADALANGDTSSFNPALRVEIEPTCLQWLLLPSALEMGRKAEEEHRKFKASGYDPRRGERIRKRKAYEKLRVTDPW